MKKITLSLAFAFVAMLAMSSCKKDYTCECVTTDPIDGTKTTVKTTINDKKKKAEDACNKLDQPLFGMECSIN